MTDFAAVIGGTIPAVLRMSDARLADVAHNLLIARGHRSGVPRVVAVDRNEPRELAGSLFIDGSSKDNAIAQLAAINALLRGGTTLAMQSRDATYAVTLNVLPSAASIPQLGNIAFENDHAGWVPCRLTCEPYAYGSELTLHDAVVTLPGIVDLTGLVTDYETPLFVQVSTSPAMLHALWMGTVTDPAADIDTYLRECEDLTWTGGTASDHSSASDHGGYSEQNTAAGSASSASVADTDLAGDTYILLGRTTQSGDGQAIYQLVDPVGYVMGSQTRNVAGRHVTRFGTARLPALGVRSSGASYHVAKFYPVAAITAYWDYIGYVPTKRGWAYVERDGVAESSKLTLDYDGQWYGSTETAALYPTIAKSGGLRALPDDRLIIFASGAYTSYGEQPSYSASVTVKAIPRHALWR